MKNLLTILSFLLLQKISFAQENIISISNSTISPFISSQGYTSKIKYERYVFKNVSAGTMLKFYKNGEITSGVMNEYYIRIYISPKDTMQGLYFQFAAGFGHVKNTFGYSATVPNDDGINWFDSDVPLFWVFGVIDLFDNDVAKTYTTREVESTLSGCSFGVGKQYLLTKNKKWFFDGYAGFKIIPQPEKVAESIQYNGLDFHLIE